MILPDANFLLYAVSPYGVVKCFIGLVTPSLLPLASIESTV
jgi:hypothetical protein